MNDPSWPNPQIALSELLATYLVKDVCLLGDHEDFFAADKTVTLTARLVTVEHEVSLIQESLVNATLPLPKTDLILFVLPESLDDDQAILLLGILRNTTAIPICFVNQGNRIPFSTLIGLGFIRKHPQLYTYDIEKYNRKRDWNNARYWANPEMFNKRF